MTLQIYAHPFSSYCQQVLVALCENAARFEFLTLGEEPAQGEFEALWPLKQFPMLLDDDVVVAEASMIIEHLAPRQSGQVRLIPEDPVAALTVRTMDRFF